MEIGNGAVKLSKLGGSYGDKPSAKTSREEPHSDQGRSGLLAGREQRWGQCGGTAKPHRAGMQFLPQTWLFSRHLRGNAAHPHAQGGHFALRRGSGQKSGPNHRCGCPCLIQSLNTCKRERSWPPPCVRLPSPTGHGTPSSTSLLRFLSLHFPTPSRCDGYWDGTGESGRW